MLHKYTGTSLPQIPPKYVHNSFEVVVQKNQPTHSSNIFIACALSLRYQCTSLWIHNVMVLCLLETRTSFWFVCQPGIHHQVNHWGSGDTGCVNGTYDTRFEALQTCRKDSRSSPDEEWCVLVRVVLLLVLLELDLPLLLLLISLRLSQCRPSLCSIVKYSIQNAACSCSNCALYLQQKQPFLLLRTETCTDVTIYKVSGIGQAGRMSCCSLVGVAELAP